MSQEDKFTREELEQLVADKEFEAKLNADELLNQLLNEPEKPLQRERFESLCFLADGGVIIAGIKLPPPTPGAWLLLTLVDCPFVATNNNRDMDIVDFYRAIYILKNGRDAVLPLLPYQSLKAELATLADSADQSDSHFAVYLAKLGVVSQAQAQFNALITQFASELGNFDYHRAVDELENYLAASFSGFDLLPRKESTKKKTTETKPMRHLFRACWRWLLTPVTRHRSSCSGMNRSPGSATSPSEPSKKMAPKVSENASVPKSQSSGSKL